MIMATPVLDTEAYSLFDVTADLNVTTNMPYVPPFDANGIILSTTLISFFFVVGFVGNVLTIAVIMSSKQLRNIFMHFLLSLCVSDLISSLISWLFLYRRTWGFETWKPIPEFFCKFYWAADIMTNYVTALHILSFAIIRYISIQYPFTFIKFRLKTAKMWMAAIWIICFLCGFIPFFIFFGARERDRHSNDPDALWPACTINLEWYSDYTTYQKICYSIFLYAPTIGVVVMSALIAVNVTSRMGQVNSSQTTEETRRKERQALMQLALIVASYLVGYVPFTAYEFWSVQPNGNRQQNRITDYWFGMIEYFFLRFSECLNPVFYNLGSAKMRKCTAALLHKYFGTCACRQRAGSRSQTRSSVSGADNDFGV